MFLSSNRVTNKILQSRVELHVHLDGSLRHETIWELSKEKGLHLPGNGTFQDLQEAMVIRRPKDLGHFLEPFLISTPCIAGDLSAIERIAYEFCEDKAKTGVLYVEARYSPHSLLAKDCPSDIEALSEVVRAVNRGHARGEAAFHVKVKSILCTLVGTNTGLEVVQLCENFKNEGVLGIDMASPPKSVPKEFVEVPDKGIEVDAFQKAAKLGIHRTVHAGETGSAEMVKRAIEIYDAERIGHGYHILEDNAVYQMALQRGIHLENCPWSSYLTGSVPLSTPKHPVVQFAEDRANFSISTDDPMVTGQQLQGDYELVNNYWGLTEADLLRANLNAARSCFLPQAEKKELLSQLKSIYGLDETDGI
ncbi:adenosine deaminase-like isoform X2 [Zootermopsis nevadensis]|uniref:Adenosine deaminase n=1 Tax=Zootermopsis nevadensis TaxID=136037 RepID=A0A067RE13_ZOONE|nr:adenosine deaminase-like isoform X2 [Zootermopsis nevadensis]KDR18263.1 Adenosine deaminase [Zootermopsis nevadensis]